MSVCAVSLAHITGLAVTSWRRRNPYLNIESTDVGGAPNGKVTDRLGSKRSTFVPTRQVKMPLWESPLALLAVRCSQQNANWFVVFLPLWKPFSPCSVQKLAKEGKPYRASWLESLHKHRDERKGGCAGPQSFPMWECRVVRMFRMFCTSLTWGLGDAPLPPSVDVPQFTYTATQVEGRISPPIFKKNKNKGRCTFFYTYTM